MASSAPLTTLQVPRDRPEPNQLTADDERYFTPQGAKYETQMQTLQKDLRQQLKRYPDELAAIQDEGGKHRTNHNYFQHRSEKILQGFVSSSKTAKVVGVALGVCILWELYFGGKWILKKLTEQQGREAGFMVSRKQRRDHSREWEVR